MAFIEKKDPVVLNIKLTSKGRELLSKGQLNFSYYTIGDSEIDYGFVKNAEMSPTDVQLNNILRPVDKNPNMLSFLTRNLSGDPYNEISSVPYTQTIIENDIDSLGFFEKNEDGTFSFLTDSDHVKQPDAMIVSSGVTGGTYLNVVQAPTYQANVNEPVVGDLLLVRWTNPYGEDTTGYTINKNYPSPNLFYKIEEISGSLASNNLMVKVDRPLPNFNGSGTTVAGGIVCYNYIDFTGETSYSTDNADEALISFLQNCQCPTIRFPFWNMSIIFTEEIVGVQDENKIFYNLNSRGYAGFVSYIQQQVPTYKKLGVIHYTNSSVSNTYAEELFYDIDNEQRRPTLDIPLVMWHKSSGATVGLQLKASGSRKTLLRENDQQIDAELTSLNTTYYDLTDLEGNVVGKVFTDLKLFVIEDQELLFAMSYKSNRSWTLPNYGVDINANVTFGCPDCTLTYQVSAITPTTVDSSDGMLYINDISYYIGDPDKGQLLLEVLESGTTGFTQVLFNKITGDTYVEGLSAGTYITNVIDLGSTNCLVSGSTVLSPPDSSVVFYDFELTQSLLSSDFTIENINNSPTNIKIKSSNIGSFIGTGYTAISLTGSSVPVSTNWSSLENDVEFNTLQLTKVYNVYVWDVTGSTLSTDFIGSGDSTVWKYYVAVGTPFRETFDITKGSDINGTYMDVSNYQTTINPSINPIIGEIEFTAYKTDSIATNWQTSSRVYYEEGFDYYVAIRERVGKAVAHKIMKLVED